MKLKKIISICLVGAMAATLLAGCGSSNETVGEEIKDDAEEVVEDVKDVAEDVGEGAKDAVEDIGEDVKDAAEEAIEDVKDNAGGGTSFEGFEDTLTVVVDVLTLYDDGGVDEVIDALNEITESSINVHLDMTFMDVGGYIEQLGLMLASGERVDLCMVAPMASAQFSVMQAQNKLMDITDYLSEYAPETIDLVGDYLGATTVNDIVYGVPDYRNYNSSLYLIMRKDVLDELGLTDQAAAISSWTDAEAIFQAVYEAQDSLPEELQTPSIIGNSSSDGNIITSISYDTASDEFSGHYGFDVLGDAYGIIYTDDDGNVSNYFANEDFLDAIQLVRDWYNNGWVYKDAMSTNDDGDTEMRNGVIFCYCSTSEYGVEETKKSATGYDVVCVPVCQSLLQTADAARWGWGVPVTAAEPEAAVAFLNLMYTNADVVNLLAYGIEGRDYDLNGEGEVVIRDDAEYRSSDFTFGNQFLAYPLEGQGSNYRELALEDMQQNGKISPYLGCSIDTDPIVDELTAISLVTEEYCASLESGNIDPGENYDDFISALEDAGAQVIIDYYQESLDAWLTEK